MRSRTTPFVVDTVVKYVEEMRHTTYCRICPATWGLLVDVEHGQVTNVLGDNDHTLTEDLRSRRVGASPIFIPIRND